MISSAHKIGLQSTGSSYKGIKNENQVTLLIENYKKPRRGI